MSELRPRVFIGSSSASLKIASTIKAYLENCSDLDVWKDGVFLLGNVTFDSLVDKLDDYDFAIMVVGPDDRDDSRGNVYIELGLFASRLGRQRTILVHNRERHEIPSDWAGIKCVECSLNDVDLRLSCAEIRETFERMGIRPQRFARQVLWKMNNVRNLQIFAACGRIDTGQYERPCTGKGQLAALATCLVSISTAYADINQEKIAYLADAAIDANQLHGDFILIGSSKTNVRTRKHLELLNDELKRHRPIPKTSSQPLTYIGFEHKKNGDCWIVMNLGFDREFHPVISKNRVTKDYGLVVRIPNLSSSVLNGTVCIFAGAHTFGTEAAAEWFTRMFHRDPTLRPNSSADADELRDSMMAGFPLIAVIECTVEHDSVTDYRLAASPCLLNCPPFVSGE